MKENIKFDIHGPIPFKDKDRDKSNFLFSEDNVEKFFIKEGSSVQEEKGVYVFTLKESKEEKGSHGFYMPYYIGQTKRNFKVEAFTDRNRLQYEKIYTEMKGQKFDPFFFFAIPEKRRGKENPKTKQSIKELEKLLILIASIKNKELINRQEAGGGAWDFPIGVNRNFDKAFSFDE